MAKLLPSRPFKLTCGHTHKGGSQVATVVKNLPANAGDETWVRSLSREDPSEGGMATHPSILTWRIPWTGDWQATVYRVPKSQTQLKQLSTQIYLLLICLFILYLLYETLILRVSGLIFLGFQGILLDKGLVNLSHKCQIVNIWGFSRRVFFVTAVQLAMVFKPWQLENSQRHDVHKWEWLLSNKTC